MPTTNQNDQGQGQGQAPEGQAPVDPNIIALATGLENLRQAQNRLYSGLFTMAVAQLVVGLAGVVYLATKPRRRRRG